MRNQHWNWSIFFLTYQIFITKTILIPLNYEEVTLKNNEIMTKTTWEMSYFFSISFVKSNTLEHIIILHKVHILGPWKSKEMQAQDNMIHLSLSPNNWKKQMTSSKMKQTFKNKNNRNHMLLLLPNISIYVHINHIYSTLTWAERRSILKCLERH